jgi:hypothetical protein
MREPFDTWFGNQIKWSLHGALPRFDCCTLIGDPAHGLINMVVNLKLAILPFRLNIIV